MILKSIRRYTRTARSSSYRLEISHTQLRVSPTSIQSWIPKAMRTELAAGKLSLCISFAVLDLCLHFDYRYCWWKKSCWSHYIFSKLFLHSRWLAGFPPSTVWWGGNQDGIICVFLYPYIYIQYTYNKELSKFANNHNRWESIHTHLSEVAYRIRDLECSSGLVVLKSTYWTPIIFADIRPMTRRIRTWMTFMAVTVSLPRCFESSSTSSGE